MAKTKIPIRSCVVCGQRFPKRNLIRIVRTLTGTVEVDPTGKKAGRGAYLCDTAECWQQALSKGRVDRSLGFQLSDQDRDALSGYYTEQLELMTSVGDVP